MSDILRALAELEAASHEYSQLVIAAEAKRLHALIMGKEAEVSEQRDEKQWGCYGDKGTYADMTGTYAEATAPKVAPAKLRRFTVTVGYGGQFWREEVRAQSRTYLGTGGLALFIGEVEVARYTPGYWLSVKEVMEE
jgi:hypothetical protein